jgi:hypothetical protein
LKGKKEIFSLQNIPERTLSAGKKGRMAFYTAPEIISKTGLKK